MRSYPLQLVRLYNIDAITTAKFIYYLHRSVRVLIDANIGVHLTFFHSVIEMKRIEAGPRFE